MGSCFGTIRNWFTPTHRKFAHVQDSVELHVEFNNDDIWNTGLTQPLLPKNNANRLEFASTSSSDEEPKETYDNLLFRDSVIAQNLS